MPWRVTIDKETQMLPAVPESPFKLVACDKNARKPDKDAMLLYIAVSMRENYCLLHQLTNPYSDIGYNQVKGMALGVKNALGVREEEKGNCLYFKKGTRTILIVDKPPVFIREKGSENIGAFKWCINWMCPSKGGSGTYYSSAESLEQALAECKSEMSKDLYGRIIRPDLRITDVWQYVQYGDRAPMPKHISQTTSYGRLVATCCADPSYPGIDVELESDGDESYAPRVLIEEELEKGLRVLVWDGSTEDYNQEIILKRRNENGDTIQKSRTPYRRQEIRPQNGI